ncbi:hypothetical protein E2C01_037659 [Portunus trituberculatus]|uniref:Uncharacterized protein n=1 Tax=Portunus trituberculatus TaxID=210409 RepID=A0A5B7F8Q0_PORTR|nr:hypothetical protein [Portunus trituberculatus]
MTRQSESYLFPLLPFLFSLKPLHPAPSPPPTTLSSYTKLFTPTFTTTSLPLLILFHQMLPTTNQPTNQPTSQPTFPNHNPFPPELIYTSSSASTSHPLSHATVTASACIDTRGERGRGAGGEVEAACPKFH